MYILQNDKINDNDNSICSAKKHCYLQHESHSNACYLGPTGSNFRIVFICIFYSEF